MENNIGKKIYDTRVIPFVKEEVRVKNGKVSKKIVDNLSQSEIRSMSCEPRMLWENKEHVYMAEMPLAYNGGTSVKWSLYYVFDELTSEEQAKYFDRSIVIPTTIESVVKVYGDSSKKVFSKRKIKEKNIG